MHRSGGGRGHGGEGHLLLLGDEQLLLRCQTLLFCSKCQSLVTLLR